MTPPDVAQAAYPSEVESALRYVGGNKYAYGPKLRDAEIAWEVTGATALPKGIVRVEIAFRPAKSFRGRTGAEVVDIGPDKSVAARRVLSAPRENLPWVLIAIAVLSLAAAGALIPWTLLHEEGDPLYVSGRTLWVRTGEPKSGPHIIYEAPATDGNTYRWAMTPQGTGTELAYIHVTLINAQSQAIRVIIDEASSELRTGDDIARRPVNPLARAFQTETLDPRNTVPGFLPLWNPVTINEGEQIEGYMVFEVPAGSTFKEFNWRATDSATVRF